MFADSGASYIGGFKGMNDTLIVKHEYIANLFPRLTYNEIEEELNKTNNFYKAGVHKNYIPEYYEETKVNVLIY